MVLVEEVLVEQDIVLKYFVHMLLDQDLVLKLFRDLDHHVHQDEYAELVDNQIKFDYYHYLLRMRM